MTIWQNRCNVLILNSNEIMQSGASNSILTLIKRCASGGRGATQRPKIYNIFFRTLANYSI